MTTRAAYAVLFALVSGPAWAQMPPSDMLPPRAAVAIVRSAGLMPTAPPWRAGASYVVGAVDRYGTPVRVVIDARVGGIVSVRPIAAGPGYQPYPPEDVPSRYQAYPPAAPGYRPYPSAGAMRGDRYFDDGWALPPPPRSIPHPGSPPAHSAAVTPARPPVPRARPSETPPAETAVAKPGNDAAALSSTSTVAPSPAPAPATTPVTPPPATAPVTPAVPSFPPAQSLE